MSLRSTRLWLFTKVTVSAENFFTNWQLFGKVLILDQHNKSNPGFLNKFFQV